MDHLKNILNKIKKYYLKNNNLYLINIITKNNINEDNYIDYIL